MKKSVQSVLMVSAYLSIALVMGCSKKDTAPTPQNCGANAQKVSDALMAYVSNPTKAGCEAYKNTVRDYVKSCSQFYTPADKKELEEALAEPCTN